MSKRDRYRIDWDNLGCLPIRKADSGASRDDLAARKFNISKAKHNGRCHISNQKRRTIAKIDADKNAESNTARLKTFKKYKDMVRMYWSGEIDFHPRRPR